MKNSWRRTVGIPRKLLQKNRNSDVIGLRSLIVQRKISQKKRCLNCSTPLTRKTKIFLKEKNNEHTHNICELWQFNPLSGHRLPPASSTDDGGPIETVRCRRLQLARLPTSSHQTDSRPATCLAYKALGLQQHPLSLDPATYQLLNPQVIELLVLYLLSSFGRLFAPPPLPLRAPPNRSSTASPLWGQNTWN